VICPARCAGKRNRSSFGRDDQELAVSRDRREGKKDFSLPATQAKHDSHIHDWAISEALLTSKRMRIQILFAILLRPNGKRRWYHNASFFWVFGAARQQQSSVGWRERRIALGHTFVYWAPRSSCKAH